jgi:hypothetical protein
MIASGEAQLLVAHPGHELLVHGWIGQSKPIVQVLTDGSGHSAVGRLEMTAEFLRAAGALPGVIFGRLSDREAYAMILECNTTLLLCLVMDLATEIEKQRPKMIVTDAAEGYNPVHDLCRMIAGAAIQFAAVETKQYEYAVVNSPNSFDAMTSEVFVVELDDAAHARKIDRARHEATRLADIDELLLRHGAEAYRRERFQRVVDWTSIDLESPPPLYERFGEQRVAAHRYSHVIRRAEHLVPLRDALRAAVEKRSCAF